MPWPCRFRGTARQAGRQLLAARARAWMNLQVISLTKPDRLCRGTKQGGPYRAAAPQAARVGAGTALTWSPAGRMETWRTGGGGGSPDPGTGWPIRLDSDTAVVLMDWLDREGKIDDFKCAAARPGDRVALQRLHEAICSLHAGRERLGGALANGERASPGCPSGARCHLACMPEALKRRIMLGPADQDLVRAARQPPWHAWRRSHGRRLADRRRPWVRGGRARPT